MRIAPRFRETSDISLRPAATSISYALLAVSSLCAGGPLTRGPNTAPALPFLTPSQEYKRSMPLQFAPAETFRPPKVPCVGVKLLSLLLLCLFRLLSRPASPVVRRGPCTPCRARSNLPRCFFSLFPSIPTVAAPKPGRLGIPFATHSVAPVSHDFYAKIQNPF